MGHNGTFKPRTRDRTSLRPEGSGTSHPAGKTEKGKQMNWTHIAALNLIADHEAGIAVSPMKLEAARKLIAA